MTDNSLGKTVTYPVRYQPDLLVPISRAHNREQLGIQDAVLPFRGMDIWNAYEISWLNKANLPQVARGRIIFPCDSLNLIESKSLKLYLNSLNQERFEDKNMVSRLIAEDLSQCAGAQVVVDLTSLDTLDEALSKPLGFCLDGLAVTVDDFSPTPGLLEIAPGFEISNETLYTNLFRSNCPVTGQPDWASVGVSYRGPRISPEALLKYLVSYRLHNDYHEHCIERIYCDLLNACEPASLTVQANFLRRGGLDINPIRSTDELPDYRAFPRYHRQ